MRRWMISLSRDSSLYIWSLSLGHWGFLVSWSILDSRIKVSTLGDYKGGFGCPWMYFEKKRRTLGHGDSVGGILSFGRARVCWLILARASWVAGFFPSLERRLCMDVHLHSLSIYVCVCCVIFPAGRILYILQIWFHHFVFLGWLFLALNCFVDLTHLRGNC